MSDQSGNGGPHHLKLANKIDPRVDDDEGSQNRPDDHLGNVHNYGKGGPHNTGIANKLDPSVNSDQDNSRRENVAASTPFMPQAGKAAGTQNPKADKPEQRITSDPDNRRENVAASTPFMPQAGKPAGNSSL